MEFIVCAECGAIFPRQTRRYRRFCSRECDVRYHTKRKDDRRRRASATRSEP